MTRAAKASPKALPRGTELERITTETQIALALNIDGTGIYKVETGIRFFDHMLELFTRHGGFDLALACRGDLDVDQHHTVEDVGIALGEAFDRALGDACALSAICRLSWSSTSSKASRAEHAPTFI